MCFRVIHIFECSTVFNQVNDHLDTVLGFTDILREVYSYEELRIPIEMLETAEEFLDSCLDETNRYIFFMKLLNAERLVYGVEKIYHDTYEIEEPVFI
ncbi:unnamed protein product [Caenorhabditis bovis]|uniref:Uncharacterized protein n=1 Tax=Caenorhabditis bovis TaxID=2654633 RepID=A0A8S1FEW1_9PELO|nr:unnamed protein product [Caenorhabditis bovis]